MILLLFFRPVYTLTFVKYKHYPVGHPTCLIGPKLSGYNINDLEGVVRCDVLPPNNLYIPLLPCKINEKLMFTLCRKCAELKQQTKCHHTAKQRTLTGSWISMELKKAVKLGYTIIQLFECWHYDTTTIYDKSTGSTGLFSQYMDAFIGLKVEASGYPDNIDTQERENNFIKEIFEREGVHLNKNNIKHNPGSRAVA